ncbi:MAG TPA: RNA methyltransferase [candidate division Zixibacteria bacterium]|nr:RNA methyltransferase [candidate division Zixibacteria bacterium]
MEKAGENTLKRLAKIGDRKYHQRFGEFLVEGVRAVEEAFRAGAEMREIIVRQGDERVGRIADIIARAEQSGLDVWSVSDAQMKKICRTTNSQGVAGGVKIPSKTPADIFGELLQIKTGLILFLDGVQDPGNVGTLVRTAEAFGVKGMILGTGSAGLFNPKTIRSTMGAIFRVPIAELSDRNPADVIKRFKSAGFRAIIGNISEHAIPISNVPRGTKDMLVIGAEASGVDEKLVELADIEAFIPMAGPTESLNASIAGGILMFALAKDL